MPSGGWCPCTIEPHKPQKSNLGDLFFLLFSSSSSFFFFLLFFFSRRHCHPADAEFDYQLLNGHTLFSTQSWRCTNHMSSDRFAAAWMLLFNPKTLLLLESLYKRNNCRQICIGEIQSCWSLWLLKVFSLQTFCLLRKCFTFRVAAFYSTFPPKCVLSTRCLSFLLNHPHLLHLSPPRPSSSFTPRHPFEGFHSSLSATLEEADLGRWSHPLRTRRRGSLRLAQKRMNWGIYRNFQVPKSIEKCFEDPKIWTPKKDWTSIWIDLKKIHLENLAPGSQMVGSNEPGCLSSLTCWTWNLG